MQDWSRVCHFALTQFGKLSFFIGYESSDVFESVIDIIKSRLNFLKSIFHFREIMIFCLETKSLIRNFIRRTRKKCN